ncbi:MAG: aldo/keto reductase, partial [Pseudomonadota bacterium]|nr:aldo/keto reductase [Pseudomonadota bacterium]
RLVSEMQYVRLGKAGVKVSRICLGTAFRGQDDDDVAVRTIDRAIDLGVNFIDCANYYGRGRSETLLGRAIQGRRDDLFITTKVWSQMGDLPNDKGSSRYHIIREVERSLVRLGTDHIDLYLLHNWDPDTPLEESLQACDDLVRQGKVLYIGACNWTAAQVVEGMWLCERHGLRPLSCLQNQYSLLHRFECEPELLPMCRIHGLGMMTYSPLAIGLLSGRFRRGQEPPAGSPWAQGMRFEQAMTEKRDRIVATLIDIAAKRGKTPGAVALAWILDHDEVTAPIIGPDQPEHVDDVFGGMGWQLPAEDRASLDEASEPDYLERYH